MPSRWASLFPGRIEPESLEAIERLADTLSFPVVLKWKDPNAIGPLLSANGISLIKAEYALDAGQLIAIGKRYQPLGKWPLIQEYCPGTGLGQFFFMHDGEALRRFQHIRIAEWPPEGGFSSVCESLPLTEHAELQENRSPCCVPSAGKASPWSSTASTGKQARLC